MRRVLGNEARKKIQEPHYNVSNLLLFSQKRTILSLWTLLVVNLTVEAGNFFFYNRMKERRISLDGILLDAFMATFFFARKRIYRAHMHG